MTIATDSVDRELVEKLRRWNIRFIRNFADARYYLPFGVLLLVLHAANLFFFNNLDIRCRTA